MDRAHRAEQGKPAMLSEETFVDFKCPYCGETVSFPGDRAGHVESCPSCSENLLVPADGSGLGHRIPLPIATPRLLLRRFEAGDWKELMELTNHESLFEFEEGGPMEEEAVLRWLDSERHVRLTTPEQLFCLGIQLREEPKLIGYIGLHFRDAQCQQALMTILLSPTHQKQGTALEAVQAVLRFCLVDLRVHRVYAPIHGRNAPALKLAQRARMRKEAEFVQDRLFRGEWVNTVVMAALKDDLTQS
jgi:[ribosomal protein S5]-alanine N-acetyltransferase